MTADTLLLIFLVNLSIEFSLRAAITHASLKYYMGELVLRAIVEGKDSAI
ncbi:hypothetical protein QUB68_14210 [Microcoleus sp. A006_D1]